MTKRKKCGRTTNHQDGKCLVCADRDRTPLQRTVAGIQGRYYRELEEAT